MLFLLCVGPVIACLCFERIGADFVWSSRIGTCATGGTDDFLGLKIDIGLGVVRSQCFPCLPEMSLLWSQGWSYILSQKT